MKKRMISLLLVLCVVFTMLPMTVQAATATLYKVKPNVSAPYYAKEWGSIVGNIPSGTVLRAVDSTNGDFAKVEWNGYPVYVWADNLKAVNAPDSVCSEWAQGWIATMDGEYVGLKSQYPNAVECDYTKPITRAEMLDMMERLLVKLRGSFMPSDYPIFLKGVDQPLTDTDDRSLNFFAKWGVVPPGKFRPNDIATYGEAVDTMIKFMEYDNKGYCIPDYGKSRTPVTRKMIANLGIGGDTSAKAPCTGEQLMVMMGNLACWAQDYNLKWYAADAKARAPKKETEGLNCIVSGTYTIQTALGAEGNHSYLNINAAGNGELRSNTPQSFKITYLTTDWLGRCYTIQTKDGRYLAMNGMAENGSPLTTQAKPYQWYISNGNYAYISSTEGDDQCLNACGQKSADGTTIISWDLMSTLDSGNENYKFIFEFAK